MNILDRIIGYVNPKAGLERVHNRARMLAMNSQVRKYEGAAEGRRHSGWLMRNNPSANQLINKDLKNLVNRSRELTINNPYAKKAPYTIANNVVGCGIIPTPVILMKNKDGKTIKGKTSEETVQTIKAAWKSWAETIQCDYNGDFSFYGLQHLAMRTIVVSGEVLVIRKRVKVDTNPFGLQLQILEGDYIDTSVNNDKDPDGGYTLYGVKFDGNYKRSGYWIFDRHPSEGNTKSSFVPVADIIHVFDTERTGQTRGVPAAASTIVKQRDLDDYEDAELLGKKGSACYAGFVQNSSPETSDVQNDQIESIEPGTITYLNPGETMTFATPPQNPGFSEFVKTQHRAIANGYLLTYEQFTGDLSNVNFSSGRMGWIEFQRQVEYWQYLMLIPKFCDKVYQWFVDTLKVVTSLPNDLVISASWTAPRRQMIDPAKEINAMKTEVRAGFTSWQEIVRQNGYNPEEVLQQLIEDQKRFFDAGLMAEWNPYFEKMVVTSAQDTKK